MRPWEQVVIYDEAQSILAIIQWVPGDGWKAMCHECRFNVVFLGSAAEAVGRMQEHFQDAHAVVSA